MTIKIEFPADRKDIALAIGQALTAIGNATAVAADSLNKFGEVAHKALQEDVAVGTVEQHLATPAPEDVRREEQNAIELRQAALDADGTGDAGLPDDTSAGKSDPSTAAQGADAAPAAQGTAVDEKGVAFNAEFCSKAAQPFYGSGKKKGQWKKRQGVDEGAYDDWYADELFSAKIEDSTPAETTSDSNVAANAFGNNNQQAQGQENIPQDAGQLMKWVSEQQAANNLTQQDVTDAYTALQLPFDAVMNPAYPVADNCAAIYNHLKGQI